jgi:hypothetical protein
VHVHSQDSVNMFHLAQFVYFLRHLTLFVVFYSLDDSGLQGVAATVEGYDTLLQQLGNLGYKVLLQGLRVTHHCIGWRVTTHHCIGCYKLLLQGLRVATHKLWLQVL